MERIIIFSHYTEIPGPSHKWLSFLQRKKYDVDYIFHPLIPAGRLTSEIKMKDKKLNFKIWQPLQFMLEGIISLIICRLNANNAPYDLAVCFDPLRRKVGQITCQQKYKFLFRLQIEITF